MRIATGTRLGSFEITGTVGKGGQGEVYRARDVRLGREVAIKVLPEHLSQDPNALRRFEREARTLASLSHQNILTIHDVGTENGIAFVVTELLEGETLRHRIAQSPTSWGKAVRIAIPIAEGLAAAHSKGVIHRDLKPENIFLSSDGSVKILDFGLARFQPTSSKEELTSAPTESHLTDAGVVMGTIPYMSPEQVRGDPVDARTDIFAFGSLLYEAASSRRAFPGRTNAEVTASILRDEPAKTDEVPPDLDHIIRHCLEKDPKHRFQSASDMAFALKEIAKRSDRSTSVPIATSTKKKIGIWIVAAPIVILGLIALMFAAKNLQLVGKGKAEAIDSLAVLPLKNLSGDSNQEFFADGMTEELIAKLARIESLRVISRTSVMEYKEKKKSLPEIAKELNVDVIVEGSVYQSGGRVRITAQLIQASTDRHLWAESYERDLRDVLTLQNEVASAIAREIRIKLTPQEQESFTKAKQVNPAAYEAYLRGIDYGSRPGWTEQNLRLSQEMFQRAVDLDPNFALAYALLGHEHAFLYHIGADATEDRIKKAKEAIDRSFELEPGSPEAHRELGYYYYFCFKDYNRALQEFSIAQKGIPKDAYLFHAYATVHRRQGNFEAALDDYRKAIELSPRDTQHLYELANTLRTLRKYDQAQRYYDQAISLDSKSEAAYLAKATNYLLWKGSTTLARDTLTKIQTPPDKQATQSWFILELLERKYEDAAKRLLSPSNKFAWAPEDMANYAAALYRFMGNVDKARPLLESSRKMLEKKLDATHQHGGLHDAEDHTSFGLILANCGRKNDAIREGKLALEFYPVSRDAIMGAHEVFLLAQIYTIVGEQEEAIKQLDYLLSIPYATLSVALLRIDPQWDPLRKHPQFQELLKKYSVSGNN